MIPEYPLRYAPGTILGYRRDGRAIYPVAGGAYVDPTAPASDLVSPVSTSQDPTTKVVAVGARASGLPTGSDYMDTLVTTAYELEAHRFLRRRLVFDTLATTRVTRQSHSGSVIQLNLVDDLDDTVSTATLVEYYDVLPTPLHSFKTSVILNEYGRVVTSTSLFRGTSMIPFDPIAAERVGRNAGATIDKLAYSVLIAAGGITNAGAAGGVPNVVTVATKPSDTLRAGYQYFQDNNVEPFADGLYRAIMTPANATALRKEADAAGWRYFQINQDAGGGPGGDISRAMIGTYEGFTIEITTGVTGGVGCVMVGNDALVKGTSNAPGFSDVPSVVVSPVVDRLRRFASLGWYFLGGYARFRAEAVCTGDLAA